MGCFQLTLVRDRGSLAVRQTVTSQPKVDERYACKMNHDYVELHRTFSELSETTGAGKDDERLYAVGRSVSWDALLQESRVVILSEAGSGKTEEIRATAQKLRGDGKAGFFLRLEHVATDFDNAFEVGTVAEFHAWVSSFEPGWIFLDSVDESRLKSPLDFESAVRFMSGRLSTVKQRAHLFLTSRAPAWRPVTDRALCMKLFPFSAEKVAVAESASAAEGQQVQSRLVREKPGFMIVALDDLTRSQTEAFARGRGIDDPQPLFDALERADAWSYTARPQDLNEIIGFWIDNGKIGSRSELMQSSIARRLGELDQNRDESRPLDPEKTRKAVRLIAAAATLMQEQTVQVPDGQHVSGGMHVAELLKDFSPSECVTLLSRPLFDLPIYGRVRFHHRTVREYLAAEWFAGLLGRQTSRRSIEDLFFKRRWGIEVIVPTLRPILPWLSAMDQGILERVRRIAPEVIFEGGDPSQLPPETRREILEQACDQLANGRSNRHMADYTAIQRFAAPELTDKINELVEVYRGNEDLLSFLMRMVWQGRLVGCLRAVVAVAIDPKSGKYARIAAFRAAADIGSAEDLASVRAAVASEGAGLDRWLLAELVSQASPTGETIDWLGTCLHLVADGEQFSNDHLDDQVADFVGRMHTSQLADFAIRLTVFLKAPPVVERRHCEVSVRYRWLLKPAAAVVQRLLESRSEEALGASALQILHVLPILGHYDGEAAEVAKYELEKWVNLWPAVRWALFWHLVSDKREELKELGLPLTDWWRATIFPSYVRFEPDDFAEAEKEAATRPLLDDRLVALTLAHRLYVEAGGQPEQLEILRQLAQGNTALQAKLGELLNPPPESAQTLKYKRQDEKWKRQALVRKALDTKNRREWAEGLAADLSTIRDSGLPDPSAVSNRQYYLFERLREASNKNSSTWSTSDWSVLETEFGEAVALAFRDGAVAFWRRHRPLLRSEGAPVNSTPASTVFGLVGLAIESKETNDWYKTLSASDVEIAFRYAMHELNGFPSWFSTLFADHPDSIVRFCLGEIEQELKNEDETVGSLYLLYDIAWAGEWMWDALAPKLVEILKVKEPKSLRNLSYMLNIIQSSRISDGDLTSLASSKAMSQGTDERAARWLAVWTGVAPAEAIDALESTLKTVADFDKQSQLVMQYVAQLVGNRFNGGTKVRGAFKRPEHLKRLYLLVHRYVLLQDDIDRANEGVYSPGLRDHATEGRERLLAFLDAIPGKEAFFALREISEAHPDAESRPWLALKAKTKAQEDADLQKWTTDQLIDFNAKLERTPSNHKELFELAALRMEELKSDLEDGDSSIASLLISASEETDLRKYIGNLERSTANSRYVIPQEEQLADDKRPDFRWFGVGFDNPVPMELKIADRWPGPKLFERLENQLVGSYLRDDRSRLGLFVLINQGIQRQNWELLDGSVVDFEHLVAALQAFWLSIAPDHPGSDEVRVVGIDLTKRAKAPDKKRAKSPKVAKAPAVKAGADGSSKQPARKAIRKITSSKTK